MDYSFHITPILARWLEDKVIEGSIVMMDLKPDINDAGGLHLDINVIMSPITIRRGACQRFDWYIGCTGLEVEVDVFPAGTISEYTGELIIDVKYENTSSRKQTRSIKIVPSTIVPDIYSAFTATRDKGYEATFEAGKEYKCSCSFSGTERILTPMFYTNRIKWDLKSHRGNKAVQDYISGNLYLFVFASWPPNCRKKGGSISIRPIDWRFFDPDRKPINNRLKTLVMYYAARKTGIKFHKDGFQADFYIQENHKD